MIDLLKAQTDQVRTSDKQMLIGLHLGTGMTLSQEPDVCRVQTPKVI
jgi:hypothetical protein